MYLTCASVFALATTVVVASPTVLHSRQSSSNSTQLLTDITTIRTLWGEVSPYYDNNETYFGVEDIGLPDGCQIEQAHLLQRHGARYPTGSDEGTNDKRFGAKVYNWTTVNSTEQFTGPLAFLNGYRYELGSAYLVGTGAAQSFLSGVTFWQRYGRVIYNQTVGQLTYNGSYVNGTARPKPVLRTTGQSRIENTQINWALGFFGPSYQVVPDPTLANFDSEFDVVIIPEGGTENNTLASYDSCFNDNDAIIGYLGDLNDEPYIENYLVNAAARFQQYAPAGFNFTTDDAYAMQDICAYEYNYLGYSDFCFLFTADEWAGFEQVHDIEYYYDYSFGNPTGRAQGIGYVQELIARLTDQYITSSNSSVNSSIDDNSNDFPLKQPFYADFSHDDIIVSTLTALSLDYLHDPPNVNQYPPDPNRRFVLSHLTPFSARLVTEVIGCASADPAPQPTARQYYTPGQYGYSAANATNKFVRMRLNHGVLPLASIRGGACAGRTDGLCPLDAFLASQTDAYALSNYDYACFGNYTVSQTNLVDYDGTINATYVNSRGNSTLRRT